MKQKQDKPFHKSARKLQGLNLVADKILHHLVWANAFAQRFRQDDNRRGWRPEPFVHGRAPRSYVLFQSLLQLHQVRLTAAWAAPIVNRIFNEHQFIFRSAFPHAQRPEAGRARPRIVTPNGPSATTLRPGGVSLPSPGLGETTRMFRNAPDPTSSTELVFRDSVEVKRRSVRHEITASNVISSEMTTRIIRQLRREEDRPYAVRIDSGVDTPVVHARRDFVLELPRKLRVRESQMSQSFPLTATPVPSLNPSPIADEVIRQLDRRLVAARERMGKI